MLRDISSSDGAAPSAAPSPPCIESALLGAREGEEGDAIVGR